MKKNTFQIEIGGRLLQIKIENWTEQASGSCFLRYGDTEVLATAVMSKQDAEGFDFFPLTVDYEERFYAAGKIYGSRFIRRETRPTEEAILTSRMIDRSIRPRFPENLKREVQVIITCLSWDAENDPDILGVIAASCALSTSNAPWAGPIAAVRVGRVGGNWVLNPTYKQRGESDLDLAVTGVEENGEILVNMIEFGGKEIAESAVSEATETAIPYIKKLIDFQKEIVKELGREKVVITFPSDPELEKEVRKTFGKKLEEALFNKDYFEYQTNFDRVKEDMISFIREKFSDNKIKYALSFLDNEKTRIIHEAAIKNNKRPDGRKPDELREISCQVGILPRTHGTGLFCRGLTKTLSILTLGGPHDQQLLEGMEIVCKKRFIHHYNFPPYSTGEIRPMRGPKRREIGHGSLAEKALFPMIPDPTEFPYTIRVVSEILSSNGSTSMASACSTSLALLDAGVPIKRPVAGIAIGLMSNGKGDYKVLTDIQGPEDSSGDMDLKVAGTELGITAIQLDVKIAGINQKIIKEALEQAKKARLEILEKIKKVIPIPRTTLSPWAPRVYTIQVQPEKIGEVVGPRGTVINKMIEECGVASIDIEDSGLVYVTAGTDEAAKKAVNQIRDITREIEIGETFEGRVKKILDFGAFVELTPGQVGMVHISRFVPYRIEKIEEVVKVGDVIPVKVISIDELGRINLSAAEAGFQPKKPKVVKFFRR